LRHPARANPQVSGQFAITVLWFGSFELVHTFQLFSISVHVFVPNIRKALSLDDMAFGPAKKGNAASSSAMTLA
jgi:hypothetical protein